MGNREEGHPSFRSILYALVANLGIALAKAAAALLTGSGSLLAEAIHSFADCGNQVLLFVGMAQARKPASEEHPLGYGKATYFWSFVVAIMLFSMGGLFSIHEGLAKLGRRHLLEHAGLALAVLAFSLALEIWSLSGVLREIRPVRKGRSLWSFFKASRQSELLVVLGEDLAAIAGLVLALTAVLLSVWLRNPLFDALGSIAIGALLVLVAVGMGLEIRSLLIGESAEPEEREAIYEFLAGQELIERIFRLITLQLGQDIMVAVKAKIKPQSSVLEMIAGINRCERALKEAFPQIRWIFFEPDIED